MHAAGLGHKCGLRPAWQGRRWQAAPFHSALGVRGPNLPPYLTSLPKPCQVKAPWHLTYSCAQGTSKPCGKCERCMLRAEAFEQAGVDDPLLAGAAH